MANSDTIFISAGDPSADFPGKLLIDAIIAACPDMKITGLGGPLMQQAGLEPLADYKELAVIGFWEVLPKYLFFRKLMAESIRIIKKEKVKAVILIDYPGFNLRLAERIKSLDIPIIYYISPQVWAWGKKRIGKIKRLIDLMLVIFPFETEFYRQHGMEAVFTGHPIVDRYRSFRSKSECREVVGIDAAKKMIALLPGSRRLEVRRMLPVMIDTARKISTRMPDVEFVIAGVESIDAEFYDKFSGSSEIPVVTGRTPEIINGANLVITSSGTATLETAYFETPMVVIYKTGWLTYQIARRLVDLKFIAMVNLIAGKEAVPELIQNDASPDNIADHVIKLLEDRARTDEMVDELKRVRLLLGNNAISESETAGTRVYKAISEKFSLC